MGRRALRGAQVSGLPGQLGAHRHRRSVYDREAERDHCSGERGIRLGVATTMSYYSGHLLPPDARHTPQDFTGLADPDIIWQAARWWRFTERTDLHQSRYLKVREDGRAVALAPLLITEKPGGLLFYDPPRLAGTTGPMADPELLDPS